MSPSVRIERENNSHTLSLKKFIIDHAVHHGV